MADRPWLTEQAAAPVQQRQQPLARLGQAATGQCNIGLASGGIGQPLRRLRQQATVAVDDATGRQLQFTPPEHVRQVAEGADHRQPRALLRIGQRVGEQRHRHLEQRRTQLLPELPLVAWVVGVRHQRHAGRQQLRTRGGDAQRLAPVAPEHQVVPGSRLLAILKLGLGHGGLEGYVPQAWRLLAVELATLVVAQERALADPLRPLIDGGVGQPPVHRQPQLHEQVAKGLLIDGGQAMAQLDEIAPADRDILAAAPGYRSRRLELRLVRGIRIAAHAVVVLHAPFGGQAVVIPTHGIEHSLAAHALEAGDDIGVGVAEHMADVQRAGGRGWRCVDGIDRVPWGIAVEGVGAFFEPALGPACLEMFKRGGGANRQAFTFNGDIASSCHRQMARSGARRKADL